MTFTYLLLICLLMPFTDMLSLDMLVVEATSKRTPINYWGGVAHTTQFIKPVRLVQTLQFGSLTLDQTKPGQERKETTHFPWNAKFPIVLLIVLRVIDFQQSLLFQAYHVTPGAQRLVCRRTCRHMKQKRKGKTPSDLWIRFFLNCSKSSLVGEAGRLSTSREQAGLKVQRKEQSVEK